MPIEEKKLKLVVIERNRYGNIIGRKEIIVNSSNKNSIVNKVYYKSTPDYRKSFEYAVKNYQRKATIVEKSDKLNIRRK